MTSDNTFKPSIEYNPKVCSIQDGVLHSRFTYKSSSLSKSSSGKFHVNPKEVDLEFKLDLHPPRVGVMLVGFGGNNGSTTLAAILANKNNIKFHNKDGLQKPSYLGSVTQSSTIKIGVDETGNDVFVPFNSLLPMLNPNDLFVSGWDINSANLAEAMERAAVLDYDLQRQLKPLMENYKPLKSIYYPSFIAANQFDRADNCLNARPFKLKTGGKPEIAYNMLDKWGDLEKIRKDIRDFKEKNSLDKVIVLWTASTESCVEIQQGINDTKENLLEAIKTSHLSISPSVIFAVASILEGASYVNGSPQNTFLPGVVELAEANKVLIAGDDFKSGQTKLKSVLVQFLVDAGFKPISIASYNHLGNNDGLNLDSHEQFRSKEVSKSRVIDDCIDSNDILYKRDSNGEKEQIDHCVVIKYMKAVGDSKVAMDEYYSELMLGGHSRISIHNVCEDSLLAAPLIIDLLVMVEFFSRLTYKKLGDSDDKPMYPILSFLSYWLKAPLTRKDFKPINSLNRQRAGLDNLLKLLSGLELNNELRFEERLMEL